MDRVERGYRPPSFEPGRHIIGEPNVGQIIGDLARLADVSVDLLRRGRTNRFVAGMRRRFALATRDLYPNSRAETIGPEIGVSGRTVSRYFTEAKRYRDKRLRRDVRYLVEGYERLH